MSEERWSATYRGDVVVTPTSAACELHGDTAAQMAAHRRNDILIALEVHCDDVSRVVADALRQSGGSEVSVTLKTSDDGGLSEVTISGDQAQPPMTAAQVAGAIEGWIASRAHKLALWSVVVRLAGEEQPPLAETPGTAAASQTGQQARREQPVLWGVGAVLLLVGLTLGSVILVSVLAVGD